MVKNINFDGFVRAKSGKNNPQCSKGRRSKGNLVAKIRQVARPVLTPF